MIRRFDPILFVGARAEVVRDSMGHSEIPTSLEIYSKSWWSECQAAGPATVDLLMSGEQHQAHHAEARAMRFAQEAASESIGAPIRAPALKAM